MTKALGIDIGSSFIHLVELDGSPRRFRVARVLAIPRSSTPQHAAGELDSEAQPVVRSDELQRDLKRALEEFGPVRDRVVLSVRGSACILRNFTVPFRGRDEIRKVLKFESEGQIHSHSIDDVVVDAAVVTEDENGTELFMAACPKATLAPQLELLAKHGVSPEKADLDCALLFQAAKHVGAIEEGEANELDLLVGIGQSAIQLVLTRGGRLAMSRVLRWGLDNLETELASSLGSEPLAVHDAMHRYFELPTAADYSRPGEHIEESDEEVHEELIHVPEPVGIAVHEEDLRLAAQRLAQRLTREVFRFLAGLRETGTLRQVILTGGGARLPGIDQMLADELQLEVTTLDLLSRTTGEQSDPGLDTAFAAAMTALGTTRPTMNFRQEELAFRRKFDQLKVPIAVAVWLFLGYVVLTCINLTAERSHIDVVIGVPRASAPNEAQTRTPRYSGLLENLGSPIKSKSWVLTRVADPKRAQDILEAMARQERPGERVRTLYNELSRLKKDLEKETGYFPELKLESGLAVLQAFSEIVDSADKAPSIGRFVVTEIDLDVDYRRPRLSFTIAFRGDDFRQQFANFLQICKDACSGGPGPFAKIEQKRGEEPFTDVTGASYDLEFELRTDFGVFQPASF